MLVLVSAAAHDSSQILAAWLNAEHEQVQLAVDGGDFGRPITAEGIRDTWSNLGSWVHSNRGRRLIEQQTCLAYSEEGSPFGHVELNVMLALDGDNNPINRFCGTEHAFAILGNIIMSPSVRRRGLGTHMIRQACQHAFQLPSQPTRVVLLVKEDYSEARRFYRRAGFVDTDLTMAKGGVIFRLVSCNRPGAKVGLVEESDAQRLASWLAAEDDAVQMAVDGGDFGRPVSTKGVQSKWTGMLAWCRNERARELLHHRIFTARQGGCACGHIEVLVAKSIDANHNPINTFCGLLPFAVLL